jgi:hypothetical protein
LIEPKEILPPDPNGCTHHGSCLRKVNELDALTDDMYDFVLSNQEHGENVRGLQETTMGKSTRGVELEAVDDLDERQIAAWMEQVAAVPGVGGKKR